MLNLNKGIVLIGKQALPGQVKTRLAQTIGHERACAIYTIMARHVCEIAVGSGYPVAVSFKGSQDSSLAKQCAALGATLYTQPKGTLGDIIHDALCRFEHTVALGMDMPLLSSSHFHTALSTNNIAIGPAEDGGYWCIAASRPPKHIFKEIEWSTERVLQQTLTKINNSSLSVSLLDLKYDIDTYADLTRLLKDPSLPASLHQRISSYA